MAETGRSSIPVEEAAWHIQQACAFAYAYGLLHVLISQATPDGRTIDTDLRRAVRTFSRVVAEIVETQEET
jgi:hypothetical protein